jgi:hypothetical protein
MGAGKAVGVLRLRVGLGHRGGEDSFSRRSAVLTVEMLDKCDRFRADLAEAFARTTSAQERFAISEALEFVVAARRALQRNGGVDGGPPPVGDPTQDTDESTPLVIEEPPPPSAAMSAVDTTYASASDEAPPAAGHAPGWRSTASGAATADLFAPTDWLDRAR